MQPNLERLSEYLDGENNEHGLDFAATHGFLCATVVGPELQHWVSRLFDGQDSQVPPEIIREILAWRQSIAHALASDEEIELPFEIEEATVDSSIGDWAIGFVDAMYLNEEHDWFEVHEEDMGMLTLPMMVLSGIDEDEQELQKMRANAGLMEQMVEEIPENLTKIYLLNHAPE